MCTVYKIVCIIVVCPIAYVNAFYMCCVFTKTNKNFKIEDNYGNKWMHVAVNL